MGSPDLSGKEIMMELLVRKARKHDKDAADAMQETVLTCWERIDTLKKDELFRTWMIRILINKCNAIYRQRSCFISDENLPEPSAEEAEYANVEWMELLKCLEEKYRTVIILYYVEGFKVREIAQILDVSESTVKGRMADAESVKQIAVNRKNEAGYGVREVVVK